MVVMSKMMNMKNNHFKKEAEIITTRNDKNLLRSISLKILNTYNQIILTSNNLSYTGIVCK